MGVADDRPICIDLFCKAGGASMGYYQAGFDVIGIDIEPQPNYPFKFYRADVKKINPAKLRDRAQVVVASPPCQAHSSMKHLSQNHHEDLIPFTRDLLNKTGLPYIIENVEGAATSLSNPITLCGSSFGLRIRRHRLFEANFRLTEKKCNHKWQDDTPIFKTYVSKSRSSDGHRSTGIVSVHGGRQLFNVTAEQDLIINSTAMGIHWMTKEELNQAIPPAYTHYLGTQLMDQLKWATARLSGA